MLRSFGSRAACQVSNPGNASPKARRVIAETMESRQLLSGTIAFLPAQGVNTGIGSTTIQFADMNGDNKLDLISTYPTNFFEPGKLSIALGNGDGTYQPPAVQTFGVKSPTSGYDVNYGIGDFNNDGKQDIAIGLRYEHQIMVLWGLGNGQVGNPTTVSVDPASNGDHISVAAADFNRDNVTDLVILRSNTSKLVFMYGGNGSFGAARREIFVSNPVFGLNVTDFDLDGVPDVGTNRSAGYEIISHIDQATPDIRTLDGLPPNAANWSAATGTLRGSSTRPSLLIQRWNESTRAISLTVLLDPMNSTSFSTFAGGNGFPGGLGIADFNKDDLGDVVYVPQNSPYQVLAGNGNGTFSVAVPSTSPGVGSPQQVAIRDLSGDGFLDIAFAGGGVAIATQLAPSLVVTTAVDEDNGTSLPNVGTGTSLREAINYARTLRFQRTISFAPSLCNANAVISLANGPIEIPEDMRITLVNETGRITIQGDGTKQGFIVPGRSWLQLRNLTLSNFRSNTDGGAVYVDYLGTFDAERVTFVNNVAAGQGAAVYTRDFVVSEIRNSTFFNNTGDGAVALDASNLGSAILENNTFSNNTIGVRVRNGTVQLRNNIIAYSGSVDVAMTAGDLTGTHNIIRTGVTAGLTNTINADPLLNAFAYNGGSTNTLSLQAGSPALNAGTTLASVTTDQRGIARPQHGTADIGAFEARLSATPVLAVNTLNVTPDATPINLAQATNPNPAGGSFSGPGVSNGVFNPAGQSFGANVITYSVLSPNADVPGTTTLTIHVTPVRVLSSAQVTMSSNESPREGTPYTLNVLISNLRDQYGAAFVPTSGSVTLSPQGLSSQSVTLTAQQLSQGTISVPFTMTFPNTSFTRTIEAFVTLDGLNLSQSYFVDVLNVAPTNLQLIAPASVHQGSNFTLSGSFVDPGEWNAFTLNIDWGDGTTQTVNFGGSRTFSIEKAYAAKYVGTSNHTIIVTVADNVGGQSSPAAHPIQVVRGTSLVVTTTLDEDNGTSDSTLGTGTSVREALRFAEQNPDADIITFAPELAGQTITLRDGWSEANYDESHSTLVVHGDVTIQGPTNGGVNLAMAFGVPRRHLLVSTTGVLTVENLTFTNGYSDGYGGAIWSQGSLTVRDSTFTGNYAAHEGGAIQAWGGSPLLRLENTTIAGNMTGNVASAIGIGSTNASMDHVTIVDNYSPNANGTIWIWETSVNVRNSIVARNTNDGTTHAGGNGSGTFTAASTNNLVGGGSWHGLNAATNTLDVNVAALRLGTLADNGGPTKTIALMPGSIAINAGTAIANVTTDQRGISRPQGSAPDVGAYERVATSVSATAASHEHDARVAIHVDFNGDASVTYSRADLQLTNLTTGQSVGANVGTWTFNDAGTTATLLLTNLLADGNYRATIGSQTVDFFVFAGDLNHDRTVDFSDLLILAQNYGQTGRTNATGDVNYDGEVGFADLLALAQNYSRTLGAIATHGSKTTNSASAKRRPMSIDLLR